MKEQEIMKPMSPHPTQPQNTFPYDTAETHLLYSISP